MTDKEIVMSYFIDKAFGGSTKHLECVYYFKEMCDSIGTRYYSRKKELFLLCETEIGNARPFPFSRMVEIAES